MRKKKYLILLFTIVLVVFLTISAFATFESSLDEKFALRGPEGFKRVRKVLVIGAGWYKGIPEGETCTGQLISQALHGEIIEGAEVIGNVFSPCDWDVVDLNIEAIKYYDPEIVLWIGQGGCIQVEKGGTNWACGTDTANPPKTKGARPKDAPRVYEKIYSDGQEVEYCTIPVDRIVNAMLEAGIPANPGTIFEKEGYPDMKFSSAGNFTCNLNTYGLSKFVREEGKGRLFGMIHVPTLPEYRARFMLERGPTKENNKNCLPLDMLVEAIRIAVRESVLELTGGYAW
jgi:pyrrolidone-carboxylate peptidase